MSAYFGRHVRVDCNTVSSCPSRYRACAASPANAACRANRLPLTSAPTRSIDLWIYATRSHAALPGRYLGALCRLPGMGAVWHTGERSRSEPSGNPFSRCFVLSEWRSCSECNGVRFTGGDRAFAYVASFGSDLTIRAIAPYCRANVWWSLPRPEAAPRTCKSHECWSERGGNHKRGWRRSGSRVRSRRLPWLPPLSIRFREAYWAV